MTLGRPQGRRGGSRSLQMPEEQEEHEDIGGQGPGCAWLMAPRSAGHVCLQPWVVSPPPGSMPALSLLPLEAVQPPRWPVLVFRSRPGWSHPAVPPVQHMAMCWAGPPDCHTARPRVVDSVTLSTRRTGEPPHLPCLHAWATFSFGVDPPGAPDPRPACGAHCWGRAAPSWHLTIGF